MRTATVLCLGIVLSSLVAGDAAAHVYGRVCWDGQEYRFDDVTIDLDDGTLCVRQERGREKVEITPDYELRVNGRPVPTTPAQRALVKEYYDGVIALTESAMALGWEGAHVGIGGALIGLQAVGGMFTMLLTDYDSDDFERDMERRAGRLEVRAEKLEDLADAMEDAAHDVDEVRRELRRQIPQLRKLNWF